MLYFEGKYSHSRLVKYQIKHFAILEKQNPIDQVVDSNIILEYLYFEHL